MRKPRNKGGRPSKFTTTAVLSIVADIASGTTREEAARAAGVGASTFYRWLQRGKAGDLQFAPLQRAKDGAASMSVLTHIVVLGKGRF